MAARPKIGGGGYANLAPITLRRSGAVLAGRTAIGGASLRRIYRELCERAARREAVSS